jgi:hypothetical protein
LFVRFRDVLIENPLGPFLSEELAKVEQELGPALPKGFTDFLRAAHGGRMDYSFEAEGEEISIGRIFLVGPDNRGQYGFGTLLGELREHQSMGIPPQVLPFAQGGGDVRFYLDLTPEGGGSVVIYLKELPEWTGRTQESAFVQIAPSFDAFLDSLRLDESEYIDTLRTALASGTTEWITESLEHLDLLVPQWRKKYPDLAADADRVA